MEGIYVSSLPHPPLSISSKDTDFFSVLLTTVSPVPRNAQASWLTRRVGMNTLQCCDGQLDLLPYYRQNSNLLFLLIFWSFEERGMYKYPISESVTGAGVSNGTVIETLSPWKQHSGIALPQPERPRPPWMLSMTHWWRTFSHCPPPDRNSLVNAPSLDNFPTSLK